MKQYERDSDYVREARVFDPDGATCGYCGGENDNADDCGWWYYCDYRGVSPDIETRKLVRGRPTCLKCEEEVRPGHIAWHGVGDR